MSNVYPVILLIALSASTALFAGCGDGGGGDAAAPSTATGVISGAATKGPVAGGVVTVFSINEDGTKGGPIRNGRDRRPGELYRPRR